MASPNQTVQSAREVALSLLKPTATQLEGGHKLHADSLVFELYGFMLRAAVDGDLIKAALESGASDVELQDLGEESSMTRCATVAMEREEHLADWRASLMPHISCAIRSPKPFPLPMYWPQNARSAMQSI